MTDSLGCEAGHLEYTHNGSWLDALVGLSHRQGHVSCALRGATLQAALEFSTWAQLESEILTQSSGYRLGRTKQDTPSELQCV